MRITMYDHNGEIVPTVKFYQKNPEDDQDFDLWVLTLRQGKGEFDITFRDYGTLHDFATRLMTEAASARP